MQTATRGPALAQRAGGRVGTSAPRIDGASKVLGSFAYGSDLRTEGMLFGATVRSPHPSARIRSIDVSGALAVHGVRSVLTADDLPTTRTYGLEFADQPVLAWDVVRRTSLHVIQPLRSAGPDWLPSARQRWSLSRGELFERASKVGQIHNRPNSTWDRALDYGTVRAQRDVRRLASDAWGEALEPGLPPSGASTHRPRAPKRRTRVTSGRAGRGTRPPSHRP